MQKIFEALSSMPRRKILAYLSHTELNAGEIASRFDISKPAVSQHLNVLENAGLIISEKRGQFVFYRLVADNLINALNGYVQEVCPVARPIKAESAKLGAGKKEALEVPSNTSAERTTVFDENQKTNEGREG